MSREGYLINPREGIEKSWRRNLFEIVFIVPAVDSIRFWSRVQSSGLSCFGQGDKRRRRFILRRHSSPRAGFFASLVAIVPAITSTPALDRVVPLDGTIAHSIEHALHHHDDDKSRDGDDKRRDVDDILCDDDNRRHDLCRGARGLAVCLSVSLQSKQT
jgi:hypothetical protein